tara:strand:- start:30 stop:215 length:186 start_codon:yes stop_codon:yes gene_type:complete
MQIGDLVEVIRGREHKGQRGVVVEIVHKDWKTGVADVVMVYIGTVGYRYRSDCLRLVECSS